MKSRGAMIHGCSAGKKAERGHARWLAAAVLLFSTAATGEQKPIAAQPLPNREPSRVVSDFLDALARLHLHTTGQVKLTKEQIVEQLRTIAISVEPDELRQELFESYLLRGVEGFEITGAPENTREGTAKVGAEIRGLLWTESARLTLKRTKTTSQQPGIWAIGEVKTKPLAKDPAPATHGANTPTGSSEHSPGPVP